jgi:hypothetical protein
MESSKFFELGEFYLRLDHISLVSPLLGSRGGFGFSLVFLGNHTHTFAFSTHEEAETAHARLTQALGGQAA